MVEKMNVDKTSTIEPKPARSSNRSPVKNDAATRPFYTPGKSQTMTQSASMAAHLDNINRIAQGDKRVNQFESVQV